MVREFMFSASVLLLAGSAVATPSDDPAQIDEQQAIQEAVDAAMVELMQPGPVQLGWDKGGVDIYKLVESAPGGTASNFLLVVDKDGDRTVRVIRARDLGWLVPKDWKAVVRAGSAQDPSGSDIMEIGGFDGQFYMAGWESHRRVGDSFCAHGNIGGELYEAPGQTADGELPRELIPAFFHATAKRLEAQQMCWRYDRDGDGFKVTYFLEDGRTLPALNDYNEHVTIVPAKPVAELLKPTR